MLELILYVFLIMLRASHGHGSPSRILHNSNDDTSHEVNDWVVLAICAILLHNTSSACTGTFH
uniref:AlNc14C46G3736 protein n=1 Tax=Albugo laibachii Nc14 TaxID=890382 RepID=F0WAL2_9STRA|nr:AlNc14C46G3736 [Albugo laibachii Nc14]|eukprot:CCA18183.1 AlNc14C46G3736 [Albugo laibachii Nc14]